jgi:5-(carboxyamino)imidazole ribonucleotide synthase
VALPPSALIHQDKLVMRRRLEALGAPVPRFAEVIAGKDVDAFAGRVGTDIVIKTARAPVSSSNTCARCSTIRSATPHR